MRVAHFYKVDLRMPEEPATGDLESLWLLAHLMDGNVPLDINHITLTLTKTADIDAAQAETIRGEASYFVTLPEYFERPLLFGIPVCTGPVACHIPRARVDAPDDAWRFFRDAPIGVDITLLLKPLCPVQVSAVRPPSP